MINRDMGEAAHTGAALGAKVNDLGIPPNGLDARALLGALRALGRGDFSVRLGPGDPGVDEETAGIFNDLAQTSEMLVREIVRLRGEVGGPGHLRQRAALPAATGAWAESIEALNAMVEQLRAIAAETSERMSEVESQNRDIEQAKAALEEKAEQLALSSRYKSEFLANMSHELRTPLNSLLILAKLLADNASANLTPKQIEYAQIIHAAGRDLLSLINDILDLAKVESGTVTLNIAPERLYDLHYYVERTFRQVALVKGLDFEVVLAPGLPAAIRTDGKRLQQILQNLLSNAFKFTASGKVMLRIYQPSSGWSATRGPLAAADCVLAFSVTDTGVGIPESKQKIIFEAFQQADGTTSRQYGGTGLGLSISRELAALLGGEIKVASVHGQGSIFTLYLPVAPEPPVTAETVCPVAAPAEGEKPPTALKGRTVLVVDDDQRNIFALASALEQQGMRVLRAADGRQALGMLAKEPGIDVVLMDVMMPHLDGYDTVRSIREKGFKDLPIIAITARAMKGDREKCLQAGASDYLAKPVSVDQLLSLLRSRLPKQSS